jgi:thiamine biosynthesis lipoprotein
MHRSEHRFVAMGGPCRLRLDHADENIADIAINAAVAEVQRLEQKYSRYLPSSLTSTINARAGTNTTTDIDAETAGLLKYASTLFEQSDGRFDLSSGCLRQAWDFKNAVLPDQQQLDALLPHIGWDRVQWDSNSIYLPAIGMEIDFGGCVKEYASDSAANVMRQAGIEHALVDLAGDIASLGTQTDGQPWHCGIRHPRHKAHAIAQVPLSSTALASSGDYERCIVIDGQRYGHILNPQTGWPVQGLVAVSVVAEQCLVAGSTATIAMLKPAEDALQWLAALGLPWLGIDAELQCHGTLKITEKTTTD